jgi:hypothetical protein
VSAEGNARLTAATAVALLVLLAAEGATIPFVGRLTVLHMFLGMLLVPVVLLKLATTAWRFGGYYLGRSDYLLRGPPHPFLRLAVAPLVVASSVLLFGTGVLLVALHPQRGLLLGLHKAAFLVWFAAVGVHVLAHVLNVRALVGADLRRNERGAGWRQVVVAGSVVCGLALAVATLPEIHAWASWSAVAHGGHDH